MNERARAEMDASRGNLNPALRRGRGIAGVPGRFGKRKSTAKGESQRSMLESDPVWYKRGVIYEVHVRSFFDQDGNGTGDFLGLTTKLEYLRDLGITAIWLLPFYPSPLKDDGYDIADYYNVHPMYGTLADFRQFLREAHHHGLRVITELVLNHTSDQHPWFQRARCAPPGGRWRDFYVWSDVPEKYKGARVIFQDAEASNWTWDHVAGAYYWHRFYSHQPDLNFDNPEVRREMFRVLDFWLDLGVDGVRLDAVPYLYEREGTSCENLPETHEFLKSVRRHVDEKYTDRMLLAEANQWPDDAVAYFGGGRGDECHMAFHFPLMPRLFMSLRMEDRGPIVDILQQTPPIPESAQWALFLRNHDELTLEMVTDEERDYMYRAYAQMMKARLNLGIRRRLAPLLGNERNRIQLLYALLFSLPGTPVIYYGDEIGMGENIYLGDRNGVRTPMQWSADKNAGFSRATPHSLYLPINIDPENHYEAVNVDVQERNPHSLLWWMKRLITLRKRWAVFGSGTMEFLHPENRKVFAFVRRFKDENVLVVANLSRFVQPVELDLSAFRSLVPVELFGRVKFPAITDKPYFFTLGPHAFYWFSLESQTSQLAPMARATGAEPAWTVLHAERDWAEILQPRSQLAMERVMQTWLVSRRWFGGEAMTIKGSHVRELIWLKLGANKACIAFLQVDFVQAEAQFYAIPLVCAFGSQAKTISRDKPTSVLARIRLDRSNRSGVLYDALGDESFCKELFNLITCRRGLRWSKGEIKTSRVGTLRRADQEISVYRDPALTRADEHNSFVVFGGDLILKFFRRLDIGVNPDLEMTRFLTAREFRFVPPLVGAMELSGRASESVTLATLCSFVPNCKNAWDFTLDNLSLYYERVQAHRAENPTAPAVAGSVVKLALAEPPALAKDMVGSYLDAVRLLAQRTAALHAELAAKTNDRNFAPEPFTPHYQRGLFQSMRNQTHQSLQLLSSRLDRLPEDTQVLARQILGLEGEILKRFRAIYERPIAALRTRYHGDYHLGQILYDGKDFWIIDFEGEPSRPLSERRLKHSPLRDVADVVHSFQYAAHAALLKQIESGSLPAAQAELARAWARFWGHWVSAVFFNAYRQSAASGGFLPSSDDDLAVMIDLFLLRKAVYEVGYELNHRPEWVKIPLQGVLELVNTEKIS
jgi:maltose alpha-D-glucosyltransferase / alpha-amylase